MGVMVAELYDALVSAGAEDGKAREAARAMASYDSRFESRFDALEARFNAMGKDLSDVKSDVKLLKWMAGAVFALNAAVLLKLLFP
uniref:Uncharacterized protein n=1 Tax=Candidatus Kentrum sp. DK TaxID=2126562 RepID=A0A450SDQ2_9GAMM|nr:MAG: hypothetical protein BECKDK2373B_GA0170837_10306 [Candidatus Kentron sp. DK]